MATKEEFVQLAAQILSDDGFEMVDASQGDRIEAIRARESSVLMQVYATSTGDGEPVLLISSMAVTNFDSPEPERMLDLLLVLNKLNSDHFFGTWYVSTDPLVVVLEHSLMVNHMTPDEFTAMIRVLEGTADHFDDQLSDFLDGQTARDSMLESAEKLRRGRV